jgi:hypothetical protein
MHIYKKTMGYLEDLDAKVYMCLVMFNCLNNTDGESVGRSMYIHANVMVQKSGAL